MPEENQHARDSAELRRLCSERDQLRSEALAGYAVRDARIAEQDVQIKVLQSNANSWQSGYDEGRRMGGKHCALTIDQQAQRIAELEGLLRHAQKQVPTGSGLHMRIDAALSAGKKRVG